MGGDDNELDELRRSHTHPPGHYVDRLGDGGLAVSAAALSLATLFVGHDSGPLHIAGAFGVPVVGVFAPGTARPDISAGRRTVARASSSVPGGHHAGTILREIDALAVTSAP